MDLFSAIPAQTRKALSAARPQGNTEFGWDWDDLQQKLDQYLAALDPEVAETLDLAECEFEVGDVREAAEMLFSHTPAIERISLVEAVEFEVSSQLYEGGALLKLDTAEDLAWLQVRMHQHLVCRLSMRTWPRRALMRSRQEIITDLRQAHKNLLNRARPLESSYEADERIARREAGVKALLGKIGRPHFETVAVIALKAIENTAGRKNTKLSLGSVKNLMCSTMSEVCPTLADADRALQDAEKKGRLVIGASTFKNGPQARVSITPEGALYFNSLLDRN